jgi:hypothetical protein
MTAVLAVMLSLVLSAANGAAKHLGAHRARFFAELTLSATNGLSMTSGAADRPIARAEA